MIKNSKKRSSKKKYAPSVKLEKMYTEVMKTANPLYKNFLYPEEQQSYVIRTYTTYGMYEEPIMSY